MGAIFKFKKFAKFEFFQKMRTFFEKLLNLHLKKMKIARFFENGAFFAFKFGSIFWKLRQFLNFYQRHHFLFAQFSN